MLNAFLTYMLLGLLLAIPLRRLLPWLLRRSGLYPARLRYLRPYVRAQQAPQTQIQAQPAPADKVDTP